MIGWVGSRFRRLPIGRLIVDGIEKEADEVDDGCFCDEDEEGGEEEEDGDKHVVVSSMRLFFLSRRTSPHTSHWRKSACKFSNVHIGHIHAIWTNAG